MFKVISKVNGGEYVVYAVKSVYTTTMFLTYYCEGWDWVNANQCEPLIKDI